MIKLQFRGMTGAFGPEHNFITDALRKKYNIRIDDKPDFNICDYAIDFHYLDSDDAAYLEMLSQTAFVEGYSVEEGRDKKNI